MRKIKEAIQLFDSGDTRSFNEIYSGKEDLFEDVEDIISPKMKALFESVYADSLQQNKRLTEEVLAKDNPYHNFTGGEGEPSGDGVSNKHNPALSKGPTSQVNQSGARQDDNSQLGSEPPKGDSTKRDTSKYTEALMKEIYEKAQLKESFEDDWEDDEFSFDAIEEDPAAAYDPDFDELEGKDDREFSLSDLDDEDDYFEDYDDGSVIPGSSDDFNIWN